MQFRIKVKKQSRIQWSIFVLFCFFFYFASVGVSYNIAFSCIEVRPCVWIKNDCFFSHSRSQAWNPTRHCCCATCKLQVHTTATWLYANWWNHSLLEKVHFLLGTHKIRSVPQFILPLELTQTRTIYLHLKCPYSYPIQRGTLACTIFSTTVLVTSAAVSNFFLRTALSELWIALISKAVLLRNMYAVSVKGVTGSSTTTCNVRRSLSRMQEVACDASRLATKRL